MFWEKLFTLIIKCCFCERFGLTEYIPYFFFLSEFSKKLKKSIGYPDYLDGSKEEWYEVYVTYP